MTGKYNQFPYTSQNPATSTRQMSSNWVQLRAMIRKDWNQMKAEKCKTIGEIIWSIAYGALIGYELDL